MADKLSLRFVETEEDLVELERLAAKVHFNIGIHDRRLQWRHSPKTHVLILDKDSGKIVGYTTGNYIRIDIFMRAHIFIEKAYRTKHTLFELQPTLEAIMPKPPETNSFVNCNGITLKASIRPEAGYIISEKLLTYEGIIQHSNLRRFNKPVEGVTVSY